MAILDQNHGLIPLEKYQCQFFDFSNFLFLKPRKGLLVLEYRKRHFPDQYCLKKKVEKWPFLDQNHGLTLFKKCQFFDFLNFLFLQPRRAFFVLEYRKRHFPRLYCLKKQIKKWPFLDQNHELTPLEKCQFFEFLNFLFLQRRKALFRSRKS